MKSFVKRNGVWIGFLLLAIAVTLLTMDWNLMESRFLSPRNLTNVLRQTSINGVLAAGMTLVILTGGIDLSIGSIVAVCGIVVGISQLHWGWSEMGALGCVGSILLSVAVGTMAGVVNGGLVSMLGIAPFVITLGMMVIARGLALILSGGSGISPMGEAFRYVGEEYLSTVPTAILTATVLGLVLWRFRKDLREASFPILTCAVFAYAFVQYKGFPIQVLFLVVSLASMAFLLTYTTLGRSIYAIGSNEQAAHWAGVPIRRVKWIVYSIMGLFSGLAGALLTARLNGAVPTAGQLAELDAIAAVVIGGTSLKGGVGTILGSFVGALTIATLNNGMDLLEVPSFYQMVFKGIIIILAVGLDRGQR
ncbi:MAG: inner-membrane translocator [Bdellovibrionia bacterium]